MAKLFIFWHIYCTQKVKQHSDIIVRRQWKRMMKYGLLDKIEKIVICKVGNAPIGLKDLFEHPKVQLIECGVNGHEYETTSRLRKWAIELQDKTDVYVLYIHNRGSTRSLNQITNDWTQCMEHHLISRHNVCISHLESNKLTVGCALQQHFLERGKKPNIVENMMFAKNGRPQKQGVWHYSGNFWWAKADYIATLPEPHKSCRFRAGEDWIIDSTKEYDINNHFCILRVPKDFDHYKIRVPSGLYEAM